MSKATLDKVTIVLLIMALIQGPVFYYLFEGMIKVIFLIPYAIFGLFTSVYLLILLIRYRSVATRYQVIGLAVAFTVGILTMTSDLMERFDFHIRKNHRLEIIESIKKGRIFAGQPKYDQLIIKRNDNGIVSVEFYIDRGFIDHYSTFLYTNDPDEIRSLDNNKAETFRNFITKIDENWYIVRN